MDFVVHVLREIPFFFNEMALYLSVAGTSKVDVLLDEKRVKFGIEDEGKIGEVKRVIERAGYGL